MIISWLLVFFSTLYLELFLQSSTLSAWQKFEQGKTDPKQHFSKIKVIFISIYDTNSSRPEAPVLYFPSQWKNYKQECTPYNSISNYPHLNPQTPHHQIHPSPTPNVYPSS